MRDPYAHDPDPKTTMANAWRGFFKPAPVPFGGPSCEVCRDLPAVRSGLCGGCLAEYEREMETWCRWAEADLEALERTYLRPEGAGNWTEVNP